MFSGGGSSGKRIPNNIGSYIDEHLKSGSSRDANVDGSSTPVEFSFVATRTCEITRMILTVQDSGSVTSDSYGAIAGGLPNGIEFEHKAANDQVTPIIEYPVQTNLDWDARMYDFGEATFSGGGNTRGLVGRWTFSRAGIGLWLDIGDSLILRINDDCTGLLAHRFIVQGNYKEAA